MEWLRLWHDMPTDPVWRTIARRSKRPVPEVLSVFLHVLVNASERNGTQGNAPERGRTHNLHCDDISASLDMDEADVQAILDAMQGKVIDGDILTGWTKRQPKREDFSASQRKAEWKERKRNAVERTGTQSDAPDTDTDTDSSVSKDTAGTAKKTPEPDKDAPDVIDPTKILFDSGVALLTKAAVTERNARTMLGRWRRQFGDEAVIAAIGTAKREGAIDPVSFIEGVFRGTATRNARQDHRGAPAPDTFTAVCRDVASRGAPSAEDG